MPIPSPAVTTRATTPYRLQLRSFYTDKPRDASASAARVVVANLQLYYVWHVIAQKRYKLAKKLL